MIKSKRDMIGDAHDKLLVHDIAIASIQADIRSIRKSIKFASWVAISILAAAAGIRLSILGGLF